MHKNAVDKDTKYKSAVMINLIVDRRMKFVSKYTIFKKRKKYSETFVLTGIECYKTYETIADVSLRSSLHISDSGVKL